MNERQAFALAHPLEQHHASTMTRFARTVASSDNKFGTVLTVDRWQGELWWHASASILTDDFKPKRIKRLTSGEKTLVVKVASRLLVGIGRELNETVYDELAYHVRRRLTLDEERNTRKKQRHLPLVQAVG